MRTLIYAGPSVYGFHDWKADEINYRPVRQSDLITDIKFFTDVNQIVIIDGEFNQSLSVWHKELLYCLSLPRIRRVIGAASMGALRAVELAPYGMIGVGDIFEWYLREFTEDEAEVALSYAPDDYVPMTVPLCNIRAGVRHYEREFEGHPETIKPCQEFLKAATAIHFSDRSQQKLEVLWDKIGRPILGAVSFPHIDQKRIDALEAIALSREPGPIAEIDKRKCLELLDVATFNAQYERERRVKVDDQNICLFEIDSYIALNAVDGRDIIWRAVNRALALLLADMLGITASEQDTHAEMVRWHTRRGLKVGSDLTAELDRNQMDMNELLFLIQQEARLRQLHNAFRVTQLHRYLTQPVLDYLRTENAFEYWAKEAAAFAKKTNAVDLVVDPELNVADLLVKYLDKQGITPDTDFFEWMEELGQGDFTQFYEPLIKASLAEKGKPDG